MARSDPRAVLESLAHLLYEQEKAAAAKSGLLAVFSGEHIVPTPPVGPQITHAYTAGAGSGPLDSLSLRTGMTLTPLPADRVAVTVPFTGGVLSGDAKDDLEHQRAVRSNLILAGIYVGEAE